MDAAEVTTRQPSPNVANQKPAHHPDEEQASENSHHVRLKPRIRRERNRNSDRQDPSGRTPMITVGRFRRPFAASHTETRARER